MENYELFESNRIFLTFFQWKDCGKNVETWGKLLNAQLRLDLSDRSIEGIIFHHQLLCFLI